MQENSSATENYTYPHPHLLGIEGMSKRDILQVLDVAKKYIEINRQKDKKGNLLRGLTQINLFFENSTRTRTSFELAGKRLGADVINMSVAHSSVKKGETLLDTAMTINAMNPDFIVVRHPESGAVQLLAEKVNCAVINAGDGTHEHPTQALLDALTIRQHKGSIEGLKVAICGDVSHSRVARSNILLLNTMGAEVRIIAPATLMPSQAATLGATPYYDMREGIRDCDIIMMLRIQMERMEGPYIPSIREYFEFFGLDEKKLSLAKPDALVMHPGPINRGVEICTELADDINRSVILDQVEMGVAVRQAVLELLASRITK
jgi:aspartate carbamoyltransferase catalytic subunit